MRRILILLFIPAACVASLGALWIFRGREISSFLDSYWTVEGESIPIHSVAYEGNGTSGTLIFNDANSRLNELSPGILLSIGSTKDNQLALASNGKVFAFGPLTSASEHLATTPPPTDEAFLAIRHSALSWPNPFDFNFITGRSPSWKRHIYYEVRWKKSSGANLELLWCYEQFFYPRNGWTKGFMSREGSAGLVRIDIKQ
jgi:hypothetical protein